MTISELSARFVKYINFASLNSMVKEFGKINYSD
jgi:hypothetical protein